MKTSSCTLQTPAVHLTRFEFIYFSLALICYIHLALTASCGAGGYRAAEKFKYPWVLWQCSQSVSTCRSVPLYCHTNVQPAAAQKKLVQRSPSLQWHSDDVSSFSENLIHVRGQSLSAVEESSFHQVYISLGDRRIIFKSQCSVVGTWMLSWWYLAQSHGGLLLFKKPHFTFPHGLFQPGWNVKFMSQLLRALSCWALTTAPCTHLVVLKYFNFPAFSMRGFSVMCQCAPTAFGFWTVGRKKQDILALGSCSGSQFFGTFYRLEIMN